MRRKIIILSMLLMLMTIFSVAGAQAISLDVDCSPLDVYSGGTVTCDLNLDQAPPSMNSVSFTINPPTGLTVTSYLNAPSGFMLIFDPTINNNVALFTFTSGLAPTNLGQITLTATGSSGASEPVTLSLIEDMKDNSNQPLSLTVNPSNTIDYLDAPICGDGIINGADQCDDGLANTDTPCVAAYGGSCTYCTTSCAPQTVSGPYCGDGLTHSTEACDDGNQVDADGCSADCLTIETDGDGDGHYPPLDCNDADASVHPQATEICTDGVDNDCNSFTDSGDSACFAQCSLDHPELCTTQATCEDPTVESMWVDNQCIRLTGDEDTDGIQNQFDACPFATPYQVVGLELYVDSNAHAGCLKGDLDLDDDVDGSDLSEFVSILQGSYLDPVGNSPSDLNNDGELNWNDIKIFIDQFHIFSQI